MIEGQHSDVRGLLAGDFNTGLYFTECDCRKEKIGIGFALDTCHYIFMTAVEFKPPFFEYT
jgi:hypothetical protein